jgi:hypothetical protein
MARNSRIGVSAAIAASILLIAAADNARAQFKAARQLTSNNIIALAGSGDTLWLATERGFNYLAPIDSHMDLPGFAVDDLLYRLWGLNFGGGGAAALVYKDARGDSIGFWHFSHGNGAQRQKFFKFPPGVYGDSARPAGGAVFSNGNFWAPFNHGGLVRYDPADNGVSAIRPGDVDESPPQNIGAMTDGGADTKAVLSLDVNPLDNSIIVTTPKALWRYHPADKRWTPSDTNPLFVSDGDIFVSFNAAFAVNKKGGTTLYSFITINRNGAIDTILHGFDNASNKWRAAIDGGGNYPVFPAVNGCVYALSENNVSVYADTSGGDGLRGQLSRRTTPTEFRAEMAKNGRPYPDVINDVLFLPRTDSSGALAVAANTGLYVCDSAEPLSGRYGDFVLYDYVRPVGSGEAYALPGVIRGGGDYKKCVFVYSLKKGGNVTIRVYDYNMSLVKTVANGERREEGSKAASGRSTKPERDFWDGTNNGGKRAWPGVYYFKITSSAGERLFGKVILAK